MTLSLSEGEPLMQRRSFLKALAGAAAVAAAVVGAVVGAGLATSKQVGKAEEGKK
jgi:hypothetical protein